MVQAYCMRDKTTVEMKNPVYSINKRHTPMAKGICSKCGGKVARILKAEETPADIRAKADAARAAAKRANGGKSKSGSRSKSQRRM